MAQNTAQIRKVQDKGGTQFFPITHVDAVIDENGDAVSTLLAGKQDTLVSGTNIKTINNESLLGSGNISVSGGGGGTVTSVAMTVPTGLSISGSPITSSGTLAVSLATGYSIPTTSKQDSWDAKGTYSKPSGGIPAADLASGVQTSLGLADTALQSYTETDPTVPSWAKASSKPSYTFSEIGTTPTTLSGYGITDAKIASGTITLGTNSITPLTSYTETDPVFSASSAAGIQSTDITAWNAKLSGVTFNGAAATVTDGVAAITATIPAAPGTLQTDLTTAQTASASEALSGSIKLHKIAKTGTYSDLIGTPTIPTKVSELTNDAGYTTNTGTVTRVDVGTSQYSPTSGIVSLPAYPTTLPASDVSAWAKESSKPSYTLDEVSDGSMRKLANYLPLTGGTLSAPLTVSSGTDGKIVLNNTDTEENVNYIDFQQNGTSKGRLGYNGANYLSWQGNKILHEGNFVAGTNYQTPIAANTYAPYNANGYLPLNGGAISGDVTVSGKFGIGVSSPTNKFEVTDTAGWAGVFTNSNSIVGLAYTNGLGFMVGSKSTSSSRYLIDAKYGQSTLGSGGYSALYVRCDGNVGFGTDNPAYRVDILGTLCVNRTDHTNNNTTLKLIVGDQLGDINLKDNDDWYSKLTFTLQDAVKATLESNGNFTTTGTITPGSDSRIKDDQQEIDCEDAIEIVKRLTPKTWRWNEKAGNAGHTAAGLVAQEVVDIIPDAVQISEMGGFKDFHSLNYNTIQGYEIAAIKGLIDEIKELKAEIAELKKQIK